MIERNKYGGKMSMGDRLLAEYSCEASLRAQGFAGAADEIAALRQANDRLLTMLEWAISQHKAICLRTDDWIIATHPNWALAHEVIKEPASILAHFAPVPVGECRRPVEPKAEGS